MVVLDCSARIYHTFKMLPVSHQQKRLFWAPTLAISAVPLSIRGFSHYQIANNIYKSLF